MGNKRLLKSAQAILIIAAMMAGPLMGQEKSFATGRGAKPNLAPAQEARPTFEFRVSKVGEDKAELMSVLAAVAKLETRGDQTDEKVTLIVKSVISDKAFLCYKTRKTYHSVGSSMSRIGGGGGVAGYESVKTDYSRVYWFTSKQARNLADDDEIEGIVVTQAEQTKKLNGDTYRQLIEVSENDLGEYSKEKFLMDLKAGKTWTLKDFATKDCQNCFGKGHGGALKKYAQCLVCKGTGKVKVDYLVKW